MSQPAIKPTSSGIVPWPAETAARYVAKGYWEGRSLSSHLVDAARKAPDAIAVVDGEVRISYRELMARADGAASRMQAMGLRADDRMLIQLPNCWEFVVLTVACLRLGVLPIWALTEHRVHEIFGLAAHAQARAIVVPDRYRGFDHQALAHEVAGAVPSVEFVFVTGGSGASAAAPSSAGGTVGAGSAGSPGSAGNAGSAGGVDIRWGSLDLRELLEPAENAEELAADLDAQAQSGEALAMFLLSGGTTGLPKLIPRSNNDLAYMIKRAAEVCEFDRQTVFLAVLPLGHGFVNTGPGVLGTLLCGGRVVIAGSPAPETAFAAIEQERVTATSTVPAIVHRWLEYRAEHPEADLSSLRLLQVGAARLAPEVARRIGPELGPALMQVFGMGEGLLCLTRLDDSPEIVQGTQGRPISPDDEIRIVDEDGNEVPAGEPGVLLTRGPYTLRGYYDSPELNARVFVEGGWYNTGDVVRRIPQGHIVVAGREKDVINRGGEKITADEVETFARQVAGVAQAAAVAMPDAELGEVVCLYVVTEPGRDVDIEDVRALMRAAGAAKFKLPERLVAVESLPVTGVGKVDKKALRADIARRLTL